MKQVLIVAAAFCLAVLLFGCTDNSAERITDMNISIENIAQFYYTYDNINYNARYQRYRFYVEDEKYMFYHETREKKGKYGPTTEEDITSSGTLELSEKEWAEVFALLKDGTAKKKTESIDDGSAGPWTYIYLKDDKNSQIEYMFASFEAKKNFEDFCAELADSE